MLEKSLHYIKVTPILLAFFFCLNATGQNTDVLNLSGIVIDATTNEGMPFATVILKRAGAGTSTNASGKFNFRIFETDQKDSLSVSYIGYDTYTVAVESLESEVTIPLKPSANLLQEVIVRPLTPEEYLKRVKKKVVVNYSSSDFSNMAYYREEVKENGQFIMHSEGVFNTYYSPSEKGEKRQHQLHLFRKNEDIHELQFMKEKAKKERRKHLEKHPEDSVKYGSEDPEDLLLTNFGGPDNLLQLDVKGNSLSFLDSTELRHYRYTYGPPSQFDGRELITIDFTSKGTVDHARLNGRIFVDKETDAIRAVVGKGEFVIPALAKPILLVMGIGIKDPWFDIDIRYYEVDGKWYPQQAQWSIHLNVVKSKMFKENAAAKFDIEQVYVVNSRNLINPAEIEEKKRYTSNLKMKDQVHNDNQIKWSDVNVIR